MLGLLMHLLREPFYSKPFPVAAGGGFFLFVSSDRVTLVSLVTLFTDTSDLVTKVTLVTGRQGKNVFLCCLLSVDTVYSV